jgi:glycosyltransferase involved in cell wall biosynthesis
LDLFLDGAALAIQNGIDLRVTIIGAAVLVPEYERLIHQFRFPDRLTWQHSMPRLQIPELLARHDVLVQPSEEENFGSSVAEAQACGLPVIVGTTNGNSDYLSACDMRLPDYEVGSLAKALSEMAVRKMEGRLTDKMKSRQCVEQHFALDYIVDKLLAILRHSATAANSGHSKDFSRLSTSAVTMGSRQMHDGRTAK